MVRDSNVKYFTLDILMIPKGYLDQKFGLDHKCGQLVYLRNNDTFTIISVRKNE